MNPIMSFQNVSRSYVTPTGQQPVLQNVNVQIHRGEFCAITGPSGAGKSTFLNLCALLDEPTSGTIDFDGLPLSTFSEESLCSLRSQSIGMVFQHYCLLPHRTVLENVLFRFRYIEMESRRARTLALDALDMVGLTGFEARPTHGLSGGEMQRVGIARAIALRPRLLVADEPTGNLDSASAASVMNCLQAIGRQEDMAILLVTHDESLLRYASRHLRCHDGALIEVTQDVAVGAG